MRLNVHTCILESQMEAPPNKWKNPSYIMLCSWCREEQEILATKLREKEIQLETFLRTAKDLETSTK